MAVAARLIRAGPEPAVVRPQLRLAPAAGAFVAAEKPRFEFSKDTNEKKMLLVLRFL